MRLSGPTKRAVAVCVLASWVFLVGLCLSESFGYAENTPEHADQTVEQFLSSPADTNASVPEIHQSTIAARHIGIVVGGDVSVANRPIDPIELPLPVQKSRGHPLLSSPKLF